MLQIVFHITVSPPENGALVAMHVLADVTQNAQWAMAITPKMLSVSAVLLGLVVRASLDNVV